MTTLAELLRKQRIAAAASTRTLADGMAPPDKVAEAISLAPDNTSLIPTPDQVNSRIANAKAERDTTRMAVDGQRTQEWARESLDHAALAADEMMGLIDFEATADKAIRKRKNSFIVGLKHAAALIPQGYNAFMFTDEQEAYSDDLKLLEAYQRINDMERETGQPLTMRQLKEIARELDIRTNTHWTEEQGSKASLFTRMQTFAQLQDPNQRTEAMIARVQAAQGNVSDMKKYADALQKLAAERAKVNEGMVVDLRQIRDAGDVGEWLVGQGIPGAATILTLLGLGAVTKSPAVVSTVGTGVGFGLGTSEIVSGQLEKLDYDVTLYTPDHRRRAYALGALSGSLETVLGPVGRGAGTQLSRLVTRNVYSELADDVMKRVAKGYVRRVGTPMLRDGVEEFFQEGAQHLIEQAGVEAEDFKFDAETLWGAFNAASLGGITGGGFGLATGARRAISVEHEARRAQSAGETVETLSELRAVAEKLKLRERSPTKFRQLAEKLGLDQMKVYYQADLLQEHFESQGLDIEQTLGRSGILQSDFLEAVRNGERVALPGSVVVQLLGGEQTQGADFFEQNGALEADGYTFKELQEKFAETVAEIEEQVARQEEGEGPTIVAARKKVFETIKRQRMQAGATARQADADATLAMAFFETQAARYGTSPEDLYERMGFDIIGPAGREEAFRKQLEGIEAQLDGLRSREIELNDLLAEYGRLGAAVPDTPEAIRARIDQAQDRLSRAQEAGDDVAVAAARQELEDAEATQEQLSGTITQQRAEQLEADRLERLEALQEELEQVQARAAELEGALNRGMQALEQRVFHGTGASPFEQFDLQFIGSGEGAAAQGWGIYLASRQEVAEFYETTVGGPKQTLNWSIGTMRIVRNGRYLDYSPKDLNSDRDMAHALLTEELLIAENDIKQAFETGGMDAARGVVRDVIQTIIGVYRTEQPELIPHFSSVANRLDRMVFELDPESGGRILAADLPEDVDYLHWDDPAAEQPEAVKAAVRDIVAAYGEGVYNPSRHPAIAAAVGDTVVEEGTADAPLTGEGLYEELSALLSESGAVASIAESRNVLEATSRALGERGVVGNKYLDAFSRPDSLSRDPEREQTFNYVIWDPEVIQIVEQDIRRARESGPDDVTELFQGNKDDGFEPTPAGPHFYSSLLRTAQNLKQGKAPPQQWLSMLRKQAGVSQLEMDEIGLTAWLEEEAELRAREGSNQPPTITREELLEFIKNNQVLLSDHLLGAVEPDPVPLVRNLFGELARPPEDRPELVVDDPTEYDPHLDPEQLAFEGMEVSTYWEGDEQLHHMSTDVDEIDDFMVEERAENILAETFNEDEAREEAREEAWDGRASGSLEDRVLAGVEDLAQTEADEDVLAGLIDSEPTSTLRDLQNLVDQAAELMLDRLNTRFVEQRNRINRQEDLFAARDELLARLRSDHEAENDRIRTVANVLEAEVTEEVDQDADGEYDNVVRRAREEAEQHAVDEWYNDEANQREHHIFDLAEDDANDFSGARIDVYGNSERGYDIHYPDGNVDYEAAFDVDGVLDKIQSWINGQAGWAYVDIRNQSDARVRPRPATHTVPQIDPELPSAIPAKWARYKAVEGGRNYRELLLEINHEGNIKTQAGQIHWPGRDKVAVHIRFDEHVDRNGDRVLMIQEIQSDWHQTGREKGYSEPVGRNEEERALINRKKAAGEELEILLAEYVALQGTLIQEFAANPEFAERVRRHYLPNEPEGSLHEASAGVVGIVISTVRDRIASATNTTRFEILTETFGENAAALDAMEAALDNNAKRSALAEELENLDRRIEALRYRDVKAAEELYDEAYKELLRVVGRDLGEDDLATQRRNAQSLLISVKQGRNVDNRYTPYTIRLAGRTSAYEFGVDRARARARGLDNIDSLPDPGALSKTWHAVAIKRMVRWAAQHGFHKVAWSTGEQQAALYSSAFGQVGMIQADVTNYGARRVEIGIQNRGVDDIGVDTDGVITYATGIVNQGVTLGVTTIHDLLGKDAANKIMAMPPGNRQALDLTEARINVGRRGQVRFYNEILPNTVKKLFKKQKVRVETTDLLTKPQLGPTGPVTQVHAIRITPELLDYAIAGFPLYQRNRGRIMLPGNSVSKGRTIIEMFEGANRSTFLHELGHYMLQAFTELALTQTAPAQMKADLQTIHEWMGREPGDVGPYTEEEQEKWARGVEAYGMKGEAPSIELRRVFARFVRWLTAIYRTVAQLNVELTPEITEVMDRMLATDDQIAIAKASQQWGPMFSTAPPGMSDQEWQAYRQLAADADDEAQAALLEKTMNQIFVQRSEEYRARKQQLSEEIAAGLGQIDTYRTLFRLQQDKEQLRLDKKQLVEIFGEEVLQELGRKRMGGRREIWSAKDGADIDVVAQSLGWTDAATMIDALRRMEPPKIKVANDVETRLREEFGDFLDSGSIQDEAVAALHRRKREQLLGAEMTAMRKHAKRSGKKLPRKRSINELREEARDLVARMSVRQAENPQLFLREERKAAREAQAAFSQVVREATREAADERHGATAEDPLVVAYRAKERQMLAHYKYIESRKVERLVQRMQRQARRLNKRSAARTVGDPYITRIHELLEQYDFRKVGPGKVRRTQQLREFIRMMTEQNRTSELAFDIDSPIVQDANRIHYTELPVEKLEELETVLKNLEHLGRTKRKLQDMHRRRLFAEERRKIVQQLNSNFDYKPRSRARSGDKTSEAGQRIRELWLVSQTTDAILMGLDGTSAADVGPIGQAIAQPIHEASARAVKRRHENWMWVRDMFKRAFGDNWKTRIKELQTTKISIQTRDGADTISLFELVALALNTGNKDNFERLTNPDSRGAMRPVEIERVLREHMTEDMWRVVAEVWERIDSFWPEIAAQERTLTGVAPPRVEAALQVDKQLAGVPDFVPNGGYYPIRYDNRLSAQIGDTDVDEMVKNTMTGTAAKAQTRHGHTKERTQTTGLPIALDFGMALRHMNDVVYDLELRQPLSNSLRLLKDAEVATAFNDRGLSAEREMLMSWVQDVANGGSMATGGVETFFRHLRVGLSTAAMGFSVSTALQQPLGLLNAANTVGPVNMVRAMFRYMSNPRKYGQHASQLSPFMEERQQTFQRDLAVMNEAMQARPDARRTWSEFVMSTAFYALQKIQFYVVDVPTWLAGYERAIRQGKTEQEAAAIADRIVARSQGSGIISDRSAIERGKMTTQSAQMMAGTEAVRAFTAFQSFMITRFSLTSARARNLIRERSSAAAMELASDITLGYVLPAMLAQLILGRLWDEREREKMEEDGIPVWWMQQVLLELASGPWINQVAAFWQSREGTNSALRGGKDVIEGLRSASELVAIMADAEDEDRAKRALKDTITSIGIMFKLPSVQINRVIEESFEDDLAVKDHISVLEAAQGKDYTFIED